eukprot:11034366-Ditylum_brightwellii.AAC.1
MALEIGGVAESFSSGYLDSLSVSSEQKLSPPTKEENTAHGRSNNENTCIHKDDDNYIQNKGILHSSSNEQRETNYGQEDGEAPDEWYGKTNPMASWSGYKHSRWGGYLDYLGNNDK